MKIAMLAPFEESVPPKKYGGTELVVYHLVEELVKRGHDVTLFGTGDANVSCRVIPIFPSSIRVTEPYASDLKSREAAKYLGIAKVLSILQKEKFDIIHQHIGFRFLLFPDFIPYPLVTTLHNPLTIAYHHVGFTASPHYQYVSISNNQRKPMPGLQYVATIYNGLDITKFPFNEKPQGDYLMFLARFSPDKGVREAITIAKNTGQKLLIATKVDAVDQTYFEETKPMIDGKQIQLIGELNFDEKVKYLKDAKALLAPIQWEEPFGLYVIEAMACGTPVLGISRGSFPELITHGVDGFLADTAEKLASYVKNIPSLDRKACRSIVEKRFSREVMTDGYLRVYEQILKS